MKFSIITITYNRAHLIRETIQSVLDQTYQGFEMIIVDDGSTDNTKSVVSHYVEKYGEKFHYIQKEHIGRLSVLRNIGTKNATGDIITILDSDDLWLPTKLEEMHAIFSKQKDVQFVFHNLQHFTKKDQLEEPYHKFASSFYKNTLNKLLTNEILTFPVFSMRRSLLKEIGPLNEEIIDGQNEYYLKAASLHKIYYHNKPLTLMRRHEQNHSKEFDITLTLEAITTYEVLRERKFLTDKQYILASNVINYKTAKYYFKKNHHEKALEYLNDILKRSTVVNKWYLKSKILQLIPYFRN